MLYATRSSAHHLHEYVMLGHHTAVFSRYSVIALPRRTPASLFSSAKALTSKVWFSKRTSLMASEGDYARETERLPTPFRGPGMSFTPSIY